MQVDPLPFVLLAFFLYLVLHSFSEAIRAWRLAPLDCPLAHVDRSDLLELLRARSSASEERPERARADEPGGAC